MSKNSDMVSQYFTEEMYLWSKKIFSINRDNREDAQKLSAAWYSTFQEKLIT